MSGGAATVPSGIPGGCAAAARGQACCGARGCHGHSGPPRDATRGGVDGMAEASRSSLRSRAVGRGASYLVKAAVLVGLLYAFGRYAGMLPPAGVAAVWAVLSAVYYFLIHPRIENALVWLSNNLAFSFIIGFFYGVFVIDLVNATALLVKIKRFADEKQIVVKYEQLREHIRVNREKRLEKAKFLMSMGPQSAMAEQLKQYYDKFRDELERSKKDARKTDGGDEK